MIGIILGILLFAYVLHWDVNSDYKKWKNNIPVQHTKEAIIRALFLAPSFFCFFLPISNLILWQSVVKFFVTFFMMQAWWWELFDGFYNKMRGYSWRFTGSNDKDDAQYDNILQKMTLLEILALKWSLIIIFTTLYLILHFS